ncbi:MAG: MFS transporter [Acidobacteria bacterium]|nr:MFS transporter [Acidobacteriota bacterium]
MKTIPHLRWWIAGLLAAATAINYLDRQNLPVVITEIQKTIPISDADYSRLQFWFLLAYGVMYAAGGRIIDLLGTRAGYAVMIVWWSAANTLHGFVTGAAQLGVVRFALGLGEGGGFPGSAKAVAEWFPARERSFAFGMFNTGSSVGAVVAPPMIAFIATVLSWRWVFFISGAAGFVWVLLWLSLYQPPAKHRRITADELRYLEANRPAAGPPGRAPWSSLLALRPVWGLCLAKFLSDSAWYFFIFWLPKYLADVRHLNIRQIGYYAWIPYAFAGAGSFFGGWLSSYLIRRGWSLDASRKLSLGFSAALMPLSLFIASSPLAWAIVFFSAAMFAHQFWSTIMQTLTADMFPSSAVGAVAGLVGAFGSFGGMLFNLLAGVILSATHSYVPVFLIAGLLHPASFGIVMLMVRKVRVLHLAATPVAAASSI